MKKLFFLLLSISTFHFVNAQIAFDSLQLVHSDRVYFDFGKYDLRPKGDSTLQAILEKYGENDELYIHITAHTDAIGTNENNQILSNNRGNTVKTFLIEKGWPEDQIQVNKYGEEQPVAENETDDGRQKNRRATIDVFRKEVFVTVKGLVKDKETGKSLCAKVILKGKDLLDSTRTDSFGRFSFTIPNDKVVGIDIFSKGYFYENKMFKAQAGKMPPLEIELPPAKKGEIADIKDLFYVGNQAVLLEKSEPVLPKILTFMQVNPNMKIEIAGHVNVPNRPAVSKDSWEFNLSVNRAKLVYNYLINNGISADRLSYQGYGNYEMRFPRAISEEKQAQNRRVEIRVLETGEAPQQMEPGWDQN